MIYSVTIEAFGKLSVRTLEAESEDEALRKAQALIGFRQSVTPQPMLDHTYTGVEYKEAERR